MARKTRRQKAVSQFVLIAILLIVCVAAANSRNHLLAVWTGSYAVAIAAFCYPVRCGAVTRKGTLCRNQTYGVLFGCNLHFWIKFKAHFGRHERAVQQRYVASGQVAAPPATTVAAGKKREAVLFWLAFVATSAGTISMTTDVIGLFA